MGCQPSSVALPATPPPSPAPHVLIQLRQPGLGRGDDGGQVDGAAAGLVQVLKHLVTRVAWAAKWVRQVS